jgi:hypothetical protein
MGATTPVMVLQGKSGQIYSRMFYFAGGDLPGFRAPTSMYRIPIQGDNTRFTVPEPCRIITMSGPASGGLRILKNGETDIANPGVLNPAVILANVSRADQWWGTLVPGVEYELAVENQMEA